MYPRRCRRDDAVIDRLTKIIAKQPNKKQGTICSDSLHHKCTLHIGKRTDDFKQVLDRWKIVIAQSLEGLENGKGQSYRRY